MADIAGVLWRHGAPGSAAEVAIPKSLLSHAPMDLPPAESGAPVDEIARAQLARAARPASAALGDGGGEPVSTTSFELAIWSPEGAVGHQRSRAVGVVCAHADAEPLLDGLAAAGIEATALRPSAWALAQAVADGGPIRCVLDAGWSNASFVAAADGQVLFERPLKSLGFRRVVAAVQERARLSAGLARWVSTVGRRQDRSLAAAVSASIQPFGIKAADEARASLAFVRRCWPDRFEPKLWIAGGGGDDEEYLDWMSAQLDVEVVPLREGKAASSAAAALGLARHAAGLLKAAGAATEVAA
ncbi:MAG: hypothetical protein AAF747_11420 [Planctomycetota bacterium]